MKHQAWLEAIRLCGGVSAYSRQLEIGRSRVSNWVSQPKIDIPYEFAVSTSIMTKVSLARLSPFTEKTNQLLGSFNHRRRLFIELPIKKIMTSGCQEKYRYSEQSIIVDTQGSLISGLAKIKVYQAAKFKTVPALVLDLKALLLGIETLSQLNADFFMSERVAIGLHLEKLLGNRQGERSDLKVFPKKWDEEDLSRLNCLDVIGRTDQKIARLLGFGSRDTYRRAKQIYGSGVPSLMRAVNQRKISIAKAAKLTRLSPKLQLNHLQVHKNE